MLFNFSFKLFQDHSSLLSVEFIKLDSRPGLWKRSTMWKAGEISFWKGFVLGITDLERQREIMKKDKDNTFKEYKSINMKKRVRFFKQFLSMIFMESKVSEREYQKNSKNIANSVLVLAENSVKQCKAETGFDLHNKMDRFNYFSRTMSMLIYVVDPMYNRVTLYMNGIDDVGNYTYEQFKPKGKNSDVVNILKAIQELNADKAPRF